MRAYHSGPNFMESVMISPFFLEKSSMNAKHWNRKKRNSNINCKFIKHTRTEIEPVDIVFTRQ